MNKHLFRIIVASATFAAGAFCNVASAQVLGGGLTGSIGGTLNSVSGSLNGAGAIGSTLHTEPVLGRSRGLADRTDGLTRDTRDRVRQRARSTTSVLKTETKGIAGDLNSSAQGVSNLAQEEAPALIEAASSSVDAAAEGTGSIAIGATTEELAKSTAGTDPVQEADDQKPATETGSLVPSLGEPEALKLDADTPHPNASASTRTNAHGQNDSAVEM